MRRRTRLRIQPREVSTGIRLRACSRGWIRWQLWRFQLGDPPHPRLGLAANRHCASPPPHHRVTSVRLRLPADPPSGPSTCQGSPGQVHPQFGQAGPPERVWKTGSGGLEGRAAGGWQERPGPAGKMGRSVRPSWSTPCPPGAPAGPRGSCGEVCGQVAVWAGPAPRCWGAVHAA